MFMKAVRGITTDEEFFPSSSAVLAVSTATKLLGLAEGESGRAKLPGFAATLSRFLHSCLPESVASWKVRRKKMWTRFHQLQISVEFKAAWKDFLLKSIGTTVNPTFY